MTLVSRGRILSIVDKPGMVAAIDLPMLGGAASNAIVLALPCRMTDSKVLRVSRRLS